MSAYGAERAERLSALRAVVRRLTMAASAKAWSTWTAASAARRELTMAVVSS